MKQTFTTTMPDRVGAFLGASRCISGNGANITRVSYNKAIDMHLLFIEADGTPEQLERIAKELRARGYLPEKPHQGSVLMLEFRLHDKPGAVVPVLEMLNRFQFNISYISSQESGEPYQYFKMGLFVEDGEAVSRFMREVSQLCRVRIIGYDKTEKNLDNTVFYLNFANEIAKTLIRLKMKPVKIKRANRLKRFLQRLLRAPNHMHTRRFRRQVGGQQLADPHIGRVQRVFLAIICLSPFFP